MHPTFSNTGLDRRFREAGYLRVPKDAVSTASGLSDWGTTACPTFTALRDVARSLEPTEDFDFFASCNDAPRPVAREVDLRLKALVAPVVSALLVDHTPFLAAIVCKAGRVGGSMDLHQDLTYLDERSYRSVMAWIPLVDVREDSGALEFVPGSHRWSDAIRPSGTAELATAPLQDRLVERARLQPASGGDVIFFDNGVIHGSTANRSPVVRPAVAVAFVPRAASLKVGFREEGGPLEAFRIDEAFFTTQPFRSRPQGYRELEPWVEALRPEDLETAMLASSEIESS